jgi:hypothetical protein
VPLPAAAATMASGGAVHASFMAASQPDIIRAAQKDDYYHQARALRHARGAVERCL